MSNFSYIIDPSFTLLLLAISFLTIATIVFFLSTRKQVKEKSFYVLFSLWAIFLGLDKISLLFFGEVFEDLMYFSSPLKIISYFFAFSLFFRVILQFLLRVEARKIVIIGFKIFGVLFFLCTAFCSELMGSFLNSLFLFLVASYFFFLWKKHSISKFNKFYNFLTSFSLFIVSLMFLFEVFYASFYLLYFLISIFIIIAAFSLFNLYIDDVSLDKRPKYYKISKRFLFSYFIIFLLILSFVNYYIIEKKNDFQEDLYTYKNTDVKNLTAYFNNLHKGFLNQVNKMSESPVLIELVEDYKQWRQNFSADTNENLEIREDFSSSLEGYFKFYTETSKVSQIFIFDLDKNIILCMDEKGLARSDNLGVAKEMAQRTGVNVLFLPDKKEIYYSSDIISGEGNFLGSLVVKRKADAFDSFFLIDDKNLLLTPDKMIYQTKNDVLLGKYIFAKKEDENKGCYKENKNSSSLGFVEISPYLYKDSCGDIFVLKTENIDIEGWSVGILEPHESLDDLVKNIYFYFLLFFVFYMGLYYFIITYFLDTLLLQVTESKYQDIFNNTNDLIFAADNNYNIVFSNPAFNSIAKNKKPSLFLKLSNVFDKASFEKYLTLIKDFPSNYSKKCDFTITDFEKTKIYLTGYLRKEEFGSSSYIVKGVFRDVTAEKIYAEKIEKANLELKDLLESSQKDKEKQEKQRLATLNILEDVSVTQLQLKESNENLIKKSKELESLSALSSEFSSVFNIDDLILKVKDYMLNNIDLSALAIFINFSGEGETPYYRIFPNEKRKVSEKFLICLKKTFSKKIIENKILTPKINFIEKMLTSEEINFSGEGNCINSEIFLELKSGDQYFGYIYLVSDKKNIYSDEIKNYLNTIASTFSVALANSQLLLKSEQSKTESLIRTLSNGIIMLNNDKEVSLVNPAAQKYLGISKYGVGLNSFFKENEKYGIKDKIDKAIKKGEVSFLDEITITREDKERIYQMMITPVVDFKNNTIGVAIVIHDITQMKYIDKMKTEFVSVASHQLRTPLTAIKLFTEMLINEQVGKISGDQKIYLSNVYESTERMVGLVNDLLNVTRIESGRLMINPKETEINSFMTSLISEIEPMAKAKKINIKYKISKSIPLIPLDRSLIRQVYHNLLTNAVRYTEEGGEIKIIVKVNKKDFIVAVSDSGVGIPNEVKERIFEKFFRAENAVKIATEGTGLGLYVSKMIVETAGGKVWFESSSKGTTFFVKLPRKGMKQKKGERGLSIS